jgi:DNA mismatch repair ATPase MutS
MQVMNVCKTVAGAVKLRSWFLRPSTDVPMLRERQAAVGHLAAPEHAEDLRSVRVHLAKVADVKRLLRKARTSARLKPQEWSRVAASCDALGQIHALASRRADCAPIFEAIAAGFDARISKLGGTVERYGSEARHPCQRRGQMGVGGWVGMWVGAGSSRSLCSTPLCGVHALTLDTL